MKSLVIILMVSFSLCAASDPSEKKYEVEARGKAKYALLTNLAIVIAAKVGLYTLILAIALVAASVKIALMMAWASTIYKYVPDPYRYKSDHRPYDPYNKVGYEKQGYETFDALADLITNRKGH